MNKESLDEVIARVAQMEQYMDGVLEVIKIIRMLQRMMRILR